MEAGIWLLSKTDSVKSVDYTNTESYLKLGLHQKNNYNIEQ